MSRASALERILQSTRAEVQLRKGERSEPELRKRALAATGSRRSLRDALGGPRIAVIAEFKRRSPSAGWLREGAKAPEIALAYERGGAAALSVLTEGPNFGGTLQDLRTARAACGLPVLRKDFVLDAYQLYEARLAGADAVLLIVAALRRSELETLRELARELALEVLVEVHDSRELSIALDAGADLIGINNRDLRDFTVDVHRTFTLLEAIPQTVTVVSESGIATPEQLARLDQAGVNAVLVGEALMRSAEPEEALRALRSYPAGLANDVRTRGRGFSRADASL